MFSIYHFFAHLIAHKHTFGAIQKLEEFPFDTSLIAIRSGADFPDIILRLAPVGSGFDGGKLIELKDSKGYTISSFNSTIPTGQKALAPLLAGKSNKMRDQLDALGENGHQLPLRDVFYLIRGRKKSGDMKICLVHGSFLKH